MQPTARKAAGGLTAAAAVVGAGRKQVLVVAATFCCCHRRRCYLRLRLSAASACTDGVRAALLAPEPGAQAALPETAFDSEGVGGFAALRAAFTAAHPGLAAIQEAGAVALLAGKRHPKAARKAAQAAAVR